MLDLGFVAFFATGAYGYALLAQYLGFSFWVAIPLTACIAALMGFVLGFPVLRMHGDYLAIVTLGFGEIIRILLVNMTDITGGPEYQHRQYGLQGRLRLLVARDGAGIPAHRVAGTARNRKDLSLSKH